MRISLRVMDTLLEDVRADLTRPHPFAAERVGFFSCRTAHANADLLIFPIRYHPVADDEYLDDPSVGAMISSGAIRSALQIAYSQSLSLFHVHMHYHKGRPGFSSVDEREMNKMIPDFLKVRPTLPHGALVLSRDALRGKCWLSGSVQSTPLTAIHVVGAPLTSFYFD